MGFPRQEHWSGLPFPSPGELPHPGSKSEYPALTGIFFTTEPPIDSPKNCAGVHAKSLQSCRTLCNTMDCTIVPARLLCPWDSPGKNTGVGCHAFLQGIFPTQKLNLCSCGSCIAGRFFTPEPPVREALMYYKVIY